MVGRIAQFGRTWMARPRTGAVIIEYALASAAVGILAVALVAPFWQLQRADAQVRPQVQSEAGTGGLLAPLTQLLP
jgi:hypothetical protein